MERGKVYEFLIFLNITNIEIYLNFHTSIAQLFLTNYIRLGTAVAQWLRRCAANRKVAVSILAGVTGIFH